jgi:pyruvate-formate lyase-activating enzyme
MSRPKTGRSLRQRLMRVFYPALLWIFWPYLFLRLPDYPGAHITFRRLVNLYRNRWEINRLRITLRSLPLKLTIEPINVCNLHCPACFTGDGQVGRARKAMPPDLYQRLLDEMGDYLWQLEFCNWGEPLLSKQIHTMIRAAANRGIGTVVNTNFSFPFSAERAEDLVRSGLTILGVSIDGARQETYEQYRVGGDLDTVLANCRLVQSTKRKVGLATPQLVWSFHMFPHNVDDLPRARELARELEMTFFVEKGWIVGEEWDPSSSVEFKDPMVPFPCIFLWSQAVVNIDGGVAPCCGTFYPEDDMGQLRLADTTAGAQTFAEVWNAERFQQARAMYRSRTAAAVKNHVCYACPATIVWDRWKEYRAHGGDPSTFDPGFTMNDSFNYFWNRRPPGAAAPRRLTIGTR